MGGFKERKDLYIKPMLIEKKLAENIDFMKLSDGFKRVFADDKVDEYSLVLPIVGYTGHKVGVRGENIFGKSYRMGSMQSKQLERENLLVKT